MADYKFFADMCIAVCVDCDKLTEKILYGDPQKVFNYVKGGLFVEKKIDISEREIGSLLFDLSSDCKMLNYIKGSRVFVPESNVTCGYLKKVIDKAYSDGLLSDDDDLEWICKHLEITQTALINREFEYNQRHISFTPSRVPNTNQALDCLLNRYVRDDMPLMIIKGKIDEEYAVTDVSLVSMVEYYIRLLYSKSLFPRFCPNCGRLFIAKSSLFDVLCSDACRKQRNSEKMIRYKERHNDEYESQYMKVYQCWYTRIRRAKEKGLLTGDKLQTCNDIFGTFTSKSYEKRNSVRNGDITPEAFTQWIDGFEIQMNMFWANIK